MHWGILKEGLEVTPINGLSKHKHIHIAQDQTIIIKHWELHGLLFLNSVTGSLTSPSARLILNVKETRPVA